jgi:hypothetical protein
MVRITLCPLYSLQITAVPIEQEAGWAPELLWTVWKRETSFASARIPTLDRPERSIVAIPPTLSWLNWNVLKNELMKFTRI